MHIRRLSWALILVLAALPAAAQTIEPVDDAANALIRKQGLDQSQLEQVLQVMNDVYGQRLTGSPELDAASDWAADEFRKMGLKNVKKEAWGPFGRGWSLDGFYLQARGANFSFPVNGYPKAWSGSTNGRKSGDVIIVTAGSADEVRAMANRIKGNVVLLGEARSLEEPWEAQAHRFDDSELLRMANYAPSAPGAAGQGGGRGRFGGSPEAQERMRIQREVTAAIFEAGPAALIDGSRIGDYGAIFVSAASVSVPPDAPAFGGRVSPYSVDKPAVVPQFTLAIEHFNRLYRLVSSGEKVTLDYELAARYYDDDPMEYNITGEIPGTDPQIGDEIVMVGAHYDAWHAGTGMADNAAGSAVMMEVMRILRDVYAEMGKSPRRTIRIGLWTGEEQGLLGSRGYVSQHFAERTGGQGGGMFGGGGAIEVKPDHAKFSAYYNIDNGTGKVRGVYTQGNTEVAPIFAQWLKPFADLDASTVTLQNTGGTDHQSFDGVGLPGFQFIQDPVTYSTKVHHSNMDVYDHAVLPDLQQIATVVASFVYHTVERDELMPRKPLPQPAPASTSSR